MALPAIPDVAVEVVGIGTDTLSGELTPDATVTDVTWQLNGPGSAVVRGSIHQAGFDAVVDAAGDLRVDRELLVRRGAAVMPIRLVPQSLYVASLRRSEATLRCGDAYSHLRHRFVGAFRNYVAQDPDDVPTEQWEQRSAWYSAPWVGSGGAPPSGGQYHGPVRLHPNPGGTYLNAYRNITAKVYEARGLAAAATAPPLVTVAQLNNLAAVSDSFTVGTAPYDATVTFVFDGAVDPTWGVTTYTPAPRGPDESVYLWIYVEYEIGPPAEDRSATEAEEPALVFDNVDQVDIVAGLVAHAQDPAYGKVDVGITTATTPTGVIRSRRYEEASHANIGRAIEEFTGLADGVDFRMEGRTLRTLYPQGAPTSPVASLTYPGEIVDVAPYVWDASSQVDRVAVIARGDGGLLSEGWWERSPILSGREDVMSATIELGTEDPASLAEGLGRARSRPLTMSLLLARTATFNPGDLVAAGTLLPGVWVDVDVDAGGIQLSEAMRVVAVSWRPVTDTVELVVDRGNGGGS